MELKVLKQQIGTTDIYLLDQILKARYQTSHVILDVGCGSGRNLNWFYNNNFKIFGIDKNATAIATCKSSFLKQSSQFTLGNLESLPYDTVSFDHVICNAVLHFANSENHFFEMFSEIFRVLKLNGTLFLRMTSIFSLENKVIPISEGMFKLPDGTTRFLLTDLILKKLETTFSFQFLEPLKTVNVNNQRCMSTLVLQKVRVM